MVVLTAGCSLLRFDPTPDPEAGPGLIGDCMPPFALHEETTLGALGIAQFEGLGAELNRSGTVRITQATVRWEDFAPPDVPAVVPEGQLLCMTWPDGGGMSTLLHEPFGQPGFDPAEDEGSGGPAVVLVALGAAVLVVLGVSWVAFGRAGARAR